MSDHDDPVDDEDWGDEEPAPRVFDDAETPRALTDVDAALLDGEAVLYRPSDTSVHHLGPVAGAVWLLADGTTPVAAMAEELAELFGLAEVEAAEQVQQALNELARAGLLEGASWNVMPLYPGSEVAPDGTEVLVPAMTVEDDPDDERPWAGTVSLRVGEGGNLLVRVRVEQPQTLDRVRALLAAWEEPDEHDLDAHRAMFSVVEGGAVALRPGFTKAAVGTELPQLRVGPVPLARSRSLDDVLADLVTVLGGLHARRSGPERAWLGLRPFVRDGHVVLLDASLPTLVGDPVLGRAGVEAPATWVVAVNPDASVTLPGPLPGADWAAAQLDPHAAVGTVRLAGCVVAAEPHAGALDSPGAVLAHLARQCPDRDWFQLASRLVEAERVVVAAGAVELRDAIVRLLDAPGPRLDLEAPPADA